MATYEMVVTGAGKRHVKIVADSLVQAKREARERFNMTVVELVDVYEEGNE